MITDSLQKELEGVMEQKNQIGIPLEGFAEYCRVVAAEGAVLLQNNDSVLPIKSGDHIAIFGRLQTDYYRSGTGSGGYVSPLYTTNILDAFQKEKDIILNEKLIRTYKAWIEENPYDHGNRAWASEPWNQAEMPVTDECAYEASKESEKAIIVIGRTAGEDKDNEDVEGSYRLTAVELDMIRKITKYFKKTVVVLNVSNIIDMSWVKDPSYVNPISSIIYVWQGGMEGGNAAVDVLTGRVNPSGKLTDTIADHMDSYPSTKNYGAEIRNYYQEDIYVGYRYFETFAPEKVEYEFGFGLSYTNFDIEVTDTLVHGEDLNKSIEIHVCVTNTGNEYAGKEVVQVYYEAPQGKLGQPVRQLISFAKTKSLNPGEKEELILNFDITKMATYDDSGVTGYPYSYVLEDGDYYFYVGNSVRNAKLIGIDGRSSLHIDGTKVVEKLDQALAPTEHFTRMRPGKKNANGTYEIEYENVPTMQYSLEQRIKDNLPKTLKQTGSRGISLHDVADGSASMENFIAQLSTKELATIVRGEGMNCPKVTPGTAAAFGGVGDRLFEYGIPVACCADGPSGIRMGVGFHATQMPIGTLLAATWNTKMVEELYSYEGKELLRNQIDTLLGPGLNIRRNPLNGRNFEYYSEDPLITGAMAIAAVKGINTSGCHGTIKHFAANNQEKFRRQVDSVVSERALREIYLKGFEMSVKDGKAQSIMSSYNPVNGHWAASNYDLCNTILRKEWGYQGIVMTDWWARMNDPVIGGEPDIRHTAFMVRSGNDIFMVVNNFGAEVNAMEDDTLESVENGTLTVGELQQAAIHICNFMLNAPVISRKQDFSKSLVDIDAKPTNEYPERPLITIKEDGIEANKFMLEEHEKKMIRIDKAGQYQLVVSICSNQTDLAQSTDNIFLNGRVAADITSNGTKGFWNILKLGAVNLEVGFYEAELTVRRAGIILGWIAIVPVELI